MKGWGRRYAPSAALGTQGDGRGAKDQGMWRNDHFSRKLKLRLVGSYQGASMVLSECPSRFILAHTREEDHQERTGPSIRWDEQTGAYQVG